MPTKTVKKSPMKFADMMAVSRVSQPAVSPDGRFVAFTVSDPNPKANKTRRTIRLLDLKSGKIRDLTPGPGNHHDPAWSPDGKRLAFVSDREKEQGAQVWVLPITGGEAKRITSGYGGAGSPHWAPDSKRIAFVRSVVVSPDYEPGPREKVDPKSGPPRGKVYGLANEKSSARIADELLFRHWDSWRDRRRNHIFLVDAGTGKMEDITPHPCDSPPISLGSERDFDFHPGGGEIAFVMNPDEVVARSTNNCVFVQKIRGIKRVGEPRSISTTEACDCHPRYSPDGKRLYYLGMEKPRYEADKNRIKLFDRETEETEVYLDRFDRSPDAFEIGPEGKVFFLAQDRGTQTLYRLETGTDAVRQLTCGTFNGLFRLIPGREEILVTRETTTSPAELALLSPGEGIRPYLETGPLPSEIEKDAGAKVKRLTRNGDPLARIEWNEAEEIWYEGAGGTPVHGFLIRPPRFRRGAKYPLILLIHGGPQGAFLNHFHYRWNAQLFASRGAVVAMLNPRGSTGYGRMFTDQISGDWGGRCYDDLMLGVDFLLKEFPFIDRKRMAAAGASFGGFMVNWIAGKTDRFRALVSHDGIFQAETMAYTTEELWFDEHEHGGMPHENRKGYLKFSPHMNVENFRTPTLVIHGDQDYRCPISEGLAMFTALQVKGVPSRFLHFPDEGHWVMQPANAEVWYDQVLGWLMKHIS